jgi:KUP system potassium uptake protein
MASGLRTERTGRHVRVPERPPDTGHLALLSLGALGIVYGDIGTSPLYAFREAIHATGGRAADEAGVLGILSMVVWSLVTVVTVKYLAVVMRADNHGEGGILALTALITPSGGGTGRRRRAVIGLGLFGTALLYGDGIITPAISVLAAVEGLELAAPALGPFVVPVAIVILLGLFAVQHLGTARVGTIFGPVMITWFVTLGVLGVGQLVRDPSVLAAVSPRYAFAFAVARPGVAFLALGGVFLVVTGAEALYADMGHFGRRPIQFGWFTVVLPALLLNYFGQGALLLADPEAATNPFFLMAPGWALLPLVGLATLATVIASQALISGAFSLTMQAVQLGYLPRVRIDHTSSREFGQVYLPAVNVALMVSCIGLVLGFRSSTALAAAYGIAVTSTMVITTVLLVVLARDRWRWRRATAVAVGAVFLTIDLGFLGANLVKIPAGGWLPLVIGVLIVTVMTTWRRGRRHVAEHRRLGTVPLETFLGEVTRRGVRRVEGTVIYLTADLGQTPTSLEANLATHHVLHRHVLIVTVRIEDVATIPPRRRAIVHDLGGGVLQVLLRFGFTERPDVPTALRHAVPAKLRAKLAGATYVVGHETIVISAIPGMAVWRERLFTLLHRNAATSVRYFGLPRDRIVEVGTVIDI